MLARTLPSPPVEMVPVPGPEAEMEKKEEEEEKYEWWTKRLRKVLDI